VPAAAPTGPTLSIGVDLGTSSVKVAALALSEGTTSIEAEAVAEYPVERPAPGWAESDPAAWWAAIDTATRATLDQIDPARVVGIGLSGQMHGVVLCRSDATPIGPALLWQDARAIAEADLVADLPEVVRRRLANPPSPGMAGPMLAWLHRHQPDEVAQAARALQPKDWVRARLTGVLAAEAGDASATLLYDAVADDWSRDVVAALSIREDLLAPILAHGGVRAGGLLAATASRWGLPEGLPVAAGTGDTAAAALGSGLVRPGHRQLTIGTGVQIVAVLDGANGAGASGVGGAGLDLVDLGADPVVHRYRSALPGGWYALAAGLNGGSALDWVRRALGVDWGDLYAAARSPVEPEGPLFVPHLLGERTPHLDPYLRGAWTGLSAAHDRDDLLRAALEGVAMAALDALEALEAEVGRPPGQRVLRLAGGGTVDRAWRIRLAEVLGQNGDGRTGGGPAHLVPVATPSASARGAALLGLRAAGLVDDDGLVALAATGSPTGEAEPSAVADEPDLDPTDPAVLVDRRSRWRRAVAALGTSPGGS
jgi:xylulokinase